MPQGMNKRDTHDKLAKKTTVTPTLAVSYCKRET